jgi:CRISPR-associated protein Cas1
MKARPKSVMLSKRANVFYLEHAKVMQDGERVVYLTQDGGEFERMFNIPERNTAFLLLGKGTSITDAAARRLAASNVVVGFCGSGGSPFFNTTDITFMSPQSEYRPPRYMQIWARLWFNEKDRLETAKYFLKKRSIFTLKNWTLNEFLKKQGARLDPATVDQFIKDVDRSKNVTELLLVEGRLTKILYSIIAEACGLEFVRVPGQVNQGKRPSEKANAFLDHGNYIAYGYASVVLNGLGISFAFPLLHGKTRRGALVFDVADLYKDGLVLPLAFECAKQGTSQQEFRTRLIEKCQGMGLLDLLFGFIKEVCEEYDSKQQLK